MNSYLEKSWIFIGIWIMSYQSLEMAHSKNTKNFDYLDYFDTENSNIKPRDFVFFDLAAHTTPRLNYTIGDRTHWTCLISENLNTTENLDDAIDIVTRPSSRYQYLIAPPEGCFDFSVQAKSNAGVALTTDSAKHKPTYEIVLGDFKNTYTTLYVNRIKKLFLPTPQILNKSEAIEFKIIWTQDEINLIRSNDSEIILHFKDPKPQELPIQAVGIRTQFSNFGNWTIRNPKKQCNGNLGTFQAQILSKCQVWIF